MSKAPKAAEKAEISVPAAVQSYGVNPVTVYRCIQMGRIEARRDGLGHWQMSRESFDRWNEQRRRRKHG